MVTSARSTAILAGINCPVCGRRMEVHPESPLPEWLDISESVKSVPLIGKYAKNEVEDKIKSLRGEIEIKRCTNCGLILTFEERGGSKTPSKK